MPENDSATVPSAGVIGLGDIGGGLASSLLAAGVDVSVCDLREEATAPFREGGHVADTPAALAARSDVVLVAVFNDAQVRAVLQGPDGVFAGAAPGTAVVIVSTIPSATVLELRAEGAPHGVTVVDCGVSGGPDAAASGDLVCMIGGSAEEVDQVRPVLDVDQLPRAAHGTARRGAGGQAGPEPDHVRLVAGRVRGAGAGRGRGHRPDQAGRGDEGERQADRRRAARLMFRTTAEPWPADTHEALLGAMRAGWEVAHKDLTTILALGADLGVALPLAELTEQRCDRVFGFDGDPA